MENTIYKSDMHKAAVEAAKKATEALQKLIASDMRLIVVDVEKFEKPEETDAQHLAERCLEYYKKGKVIVLAPVKIYCDNGDKKDSGAMLMFIEKEDMLALGGLILSKLNKEERTFSAHMSESAVTEALNIIGNAYINVVAKAYDSTIMSMVPEIVNAMNFDGFISNMIAKPKDRIYIVFDTELLITKKVLKIPFLLAVSLEPPKS
jgi:chemotaxis protein CheY-P-specific phosphatase CheC